MKGEYRVMKYNILIMLHSVFQNKVTWLDVREEMDALTRRERTSSGSNVIQSKT